MQCTQVSQEHFSRQMTFRITKSLLSYSFEGANVESLLGSSPLSPLAKKKTSRTYTTTSGEHELKLTKTQLFRPLNEHKLSAWHDHFNFISSGAFVCPRHPYMVH